ncbi:MAG: hypothetical protein C0613_09330 [Desulfobulbaceae bacterium]|nr:MAG: hypothetical protein C0613_09330 [Desulfobulbaceae bacterium]
MSEKTNLEKLRILLPHWIEHSQSHQDEFRKWVEVARTEGQAEAAARIDRALALMADTDQALEEALELLGGKLGEHHHHGHHHH